MPSTTQNEPSYREYIAWDIPTRWFHWVNALAVLGLIATGVGILTGSQLGLSSEGKIALKSIHVILGYVMAVNLLWRFIWAFFGNRYARWRAILPGGPGFNAALRSYIASFLTGEPEQYVGHNPLARFGVALLLLLLLIQVITGLVLAGTDLYWPPFGGLVADWVAAPGVDPGALLPGSKELTDGAAYQSMRDFRAPIVETHEITFYLLVAAVVIHIAAVVVTELHEASPPPCSRAARSSAGGRLMRGKAAYGISCYGSYLNTDSDEALARASAVSRSLALEACGLCS